MDLVTISDHNTLEGALRIADRPGAFLSVEVTTRFPEDDTPLHVLVWNLSEEDHRDLQPLRGSVYELVGFLARARARPRARPPALPHGGGADRLARRADDAALRRSGRGRNGARPRSSNELACRLAAAVGPGVPRQARRPPRASSPRTAAGSGSAAAPTITARSTSPPPGPRRPASDAGRLPRRGRVRGGRRRTGSTARRSSSPTPSGALALNAYRPDGRELPRVPRRRRSRRSSTGGGEVAAPPRGDHRRRRARSPACWASAPAQGGLGLDALPTAGRAHRLARCSRARLELPYLASMRHHVGTRADVEPLAAAFFGPSRRAQRAARPRLHRHLQRDQRRRGHDAPARRSRGRGRDRARRSPPPTRRRSDGAGRRSGSRPTGRCRSRPTSASSLNFPLLTKVLARVEAEEPDLIHVATPGPIGLCGLAAAKLLGLPLVGSYHTELGPYALHLTRDAVVADAFSTSTSTGSTASATACSRRPARSPSALEQRRPRRRASGSGAAASTRPLFAPERRAETLRASLLGGGETLAALGRPASRTRSGSTSCSTRSALLAAETLGLRLVDRRRRPGARAARGARARTG